MYVRCHDFEVLGDALCSLYYFQTVNPELLSNKSTRCVFGEETGDEERSTGNTQTESFYRLCYYMKRLW